MSKPIGIYAFAAWLVLHAAASFAQSAQEIVAATDKVRNASQPFRSTLTLTEFGILRTLIERPGKVCSRDHLMNTAYELHKIVSDRTIDSHVRRVRAKFTALGADPVETLHGVGYRLGPCE